MEFTEFKIKGMTCDHCAKHDSGQANTNQLITPVLQKEL